MRQEADNDTFCDWSGKQEKTNHPLVSEVKRRDQIYTIYIIYNIYYIIYI